MKVVSIFNTLNGVHLKLNRAYHKIGARQRNDKHWLTVGAIYQSGERQATVPPAAAGLWRNFFTISGRFNFLRLPVEYLTQ